MTKTEFENKYIQNLLLSVKSTSPIDCNTFKSDFDSVIKDELDKFKAGIPEWDKFKYTPKEYIEVIQSYLNSTK